MNRAALILALAGLAGLTVIAAGCGKKSADTPPEKIVNITTAVVQKKNLQVVESAVGNATSLGVAQALDPTQVQRGTFTVRLPFPEHVARQIKPRQAVRLTSFDYPDRSANATVKEIRPALDSSTQTMEVIAELPGGASWYSVGSVRGEIVTGVRQGARVVPEQAVVLRPAGPVVYVIEGEIVKERPVTTGLLRNGELEITAGLEAGETVAVDGASLLSGDAKVRVMSTQAPAAVPKTRP